MSEKNGQSTAQAILETAERLFLEKGFAMTSTVEIAKEVGCNQALVHYYYRTKENLFNVIFENKFRLFFQQIFDLNKTEQLTFKEKLRLIIESHFDMIRENPKLPLLIINELSRQPAHIHLLREKLIPVAGSFAAQLEKELQQEILAGKVRDVSLVDLIVTMVSLNVMLFLLMPVVGVAFQMSDIQKEMIFSSRRKEHVQIILNHLETMGK